MNALGRELLALIDQTGPIPLDRYMSIALTHPTLGYYTTREPFGATGDFVTAPEVSQMFGEMFGLRAAVAAREAGVSKIRLIELGPGRGTLASDMARVLAKVGGVEPRLHLVEVSPRLREVQRATLAWAGVEVSWHDDLSSIPEGFTILVANEFLDALPIRQFARRGGRWHERVVGRVGEGLGIGLAPEPTLEGTIPPRWRDVAEGAILELSPARADACRAIATRLAVHGGLALVADYGPARWGPGDTFQALRAHGHADPFALPGTADLTSHVDFDALVAAGHAAGLVVHGPIEQGAWLSEFGIGERLARLQRGKPADVVERLASEHRRLVSPDEMGALFKIVELSRPGGATP